MGCGRGRALRLRDPSYRCSTSVYLAVIQRLISWMDSSVRDQERSGSALSDISGYHRRRMYVCMYFQYDLEIWLVVSRKCAQNILHLRKFPSNSPFPGLYVKFGMRHQLLVGIIFKILCQYRKIMSVGPFSRIWVVSLGRGEVYTPITPPLYKGLLSSADV